MNAEYPWVGLEGQTVAAVGGRQPGAPGATVHTTGFLERLAFFFTQCAV